jgi:hypothetical protein
MSGLVLREGRLFIGLSRSLVVETDPAKFQVKARGVFLNRGEHWIKTGLVGRGESWFFGISMANPGKSLKYEPINVDDDYLTTDDAFGPLNSNGSLING